MCLSCCGWVYYPLIPFFIDMVIEYIRSSYILSLLVCSLIVSTFFVLVDLIWFFITFKSKRYFLNGKEYKDYNDFI